MATNSIREDEDVSTVKKSVTIKRLLSYLFKHKKTIVAVMFIMAYCVGVSLVKLLYRRNGFRETVGKPTKHFHRPYDVIGVAYESCDHTECNDFGIVKVEESTHYKYDKRNDP